MLSLTYDELLRYTAEERDKWRRFFGTHPDAVGVAIHPDDGFDTAGKLIDHIFLVERRCVQRLRGESPVDRTGLTGNNAAPLFDYGASVRRELEQYVSDLDDDVASQVRTFEMRDRQWPMTPRKLLFHILVHEIRHWAQIALAVRLAGIDPPGDHDLLHSRALR